MNSLNVGLIGYGEVGRILAQDLDRVGARVTVYDLRFDAAGDDLKAAADAAGVARAASLAEAARGRDLVISAVTAASAEEVSRDAAPSLGSFFLDLNSVSPSTRAQSAGYVDAGGGRYVEAAVMAPIGPKRVATPILLGGPHAEAAAPLLAGLGFSADVFAPVVGRASAVKMCRSIFVKGLESIVSESMLAARRYGVEAEVLSSFTNTIPHADWPGLAKYLITRTLVHGRRRSEEMAEAVHTITEVGLPAWMSEGSVLRQAWAAELGVEDPETMPLDRLLDLMLAMSAGARQPANEQ